MNKLIVLISLLTMTVSCSKEDLINCNQTVTSYYLEPYYDGYFYGYNQYTVFTVDSYGYTYTYVDTTKVPFIGMCW